MENVIAVKQNSIIDYSKLKVLSVELQKNMKAYDVNSLVVNEDTVKDVKKFRTDIRKQFAELEDARKSLKSEIEAPYKEFLEFYSTNIADMYKSADSTLKSSIDKVENDLREEKTSSIKEHFETIKREKGFDFPEYEDLKINVTLSASEASLKTEVETKFDKIEQDVFIINTQEDATRIMVRYKQTLDLQGAIVQVAKEVEQENEMLRQQKESQALKELNQQEEQLDLMEEEPFVNMQEPESTHVEASGFSEEALIRLNEDVKEVTFTVFGSKREINMLRNFLKSSGIKYKGAIQ